MTTQPNHWERSNKCSHNSHCDYQCGVAEKLGNGKDVFFCQYIDVRKCQYAKPVNEEKRND